MFGLITAKMFFNIFYKFLSLSLIIILLNNCGGGGKGIPDQLSALPAEEENSSETLDPNTDIFIPKESFETPEYKNQWGLRIYERYGYFSTWLNGRQILLMEHKAVLWIRIRSDPHSFGS